MSLGHFVVDIGAALPDGCGDRPGTAIPAAFGRPATWTNALVCVGAALFVSLSRLMEDTNSPTHAWPHTSSVASASWAVGVILQEGLSVKGLNTAATLCVHRRGRRSRRLRVHARMA